MPSAGKFASRRIVHRSADSYHLGAAGAAHRGGRPDAVKMRAMTMQQSKQLGQHFLADSRQTRRFVELVQCEPEALCVEVGPGTGNVTAALAPHVPRLIAVELDARWLPSLRARGAAFAHVTLVHGDILQFEPPAEQPLVVVGAI